MNFQLYWDVNSRLAYYESMKRNAPVRIATESADTLATRLRRLIKRMPRERRVVLVHTGSQHA